jgi:isopenicillin-N epimerase
MLDPLVISWGYDAEYPGESDFLDYHQFNGTRDYSAFLTIPTAIEELNKHDWRKQAKECNQVILEQYPRFCQLVGMKPICPLSIDFLGFMCSIPINTNDPIQLKEELYQNHKIEIPVMTHKGAVYLRISFQVYNDIEDLNKLYSALEACISKGLIKV